ncbi:MAG: ribonuclease HII [Victivallales bacterium]|nr:ribonuclease HII [Victivallales bacterium]
MCIDGRHKALYVYDRAIAEETGLTVAGIDEAGRGPLAGPVVVAAVMFSDSSLERYAVNDSKALTSRRRGELEKMLLADDGVRISVAILPASRIDEVNILRATHEGMRQVALEIACGLALVDGLKVPDFPVPARFVVKGDATSASIAAASIIAKTRRDAIMVELAGKYPEYGFERHKGYGTAEHLEALRRYGPCPEHRMSFAPVRNILEPGPVQMELPFA